MVADNANRLDIQLADAHAIEQVAQAVVEFRHQEQHLALLPGRAQRDVELEAFDLLGDAGAEIGFGRRHLEADAHEEHAGGRIVELMGLENIAAMAGDARGNGRHDTAAIAAAQGENVVGHSVSRFMRRYVRRTACARCAKRPH
jgi:hypothetical protein